MRLLLTAMLVVAAVFTLGAQSLRDSDAPLVLPREYVIGSGVITAADHEDEEGVFCVGKTSVMVPLDGMGIVRLRELKGQKAELMVRMIR